MYFEVSEENQGVDFEEGKHDDNIIYIFSLSVICSKLKIRIFNQFYFIMLCMSFILLQF